MKVQQFIIIYFIIAALAGVVAVSRLGEDFIPVYLGAVIVGGLGAAYTIKHHGTEEAQ